MGLVAGLVSLAVSACATTGAPAERAPAPVTLGPPLSFHFDSLDEREVSSEALRGRATVLLFLTTYGDPSLLQARYAKKVVGAHTPRINAAAVFLERVDNRPLVRIYRDASGIGFPCAMADEGTVRGEGPIAGTGTVPMVVVLDAEGREVWRKIGVALPDEITRALRDAQRGVWGERHE